MIRQQMNERVFKIRELLGELKWLLVDQRVKVTSGYNGQPYGSSRPRLTGKEFKISDVSFGNGELFLFLTGERVGIRPNEIEFVQHDLDEAKAEGAQ